MSRYFERFQFNELLDTSDKLQVFCLYIRFYNDENMHQSF